MSHTARSQKPRYKTIAMDPAQLQEARFRRLQKETSYQFSVYRTKGRNPTPAEVLRNSKTSYVIPKRYGRFRGLRRRAGRPNMAPHEGSRAPSAGPPRLLAAARLARQRVQLQTNAYGLRLHRTLGWGGNGLAMLFYKEPQGGGPREYFVVKTNMDPRLGRNLESEEAMIRVGVWVLVL